jgi:hypothetical protein
MVCLSPWGSFSGTTIMKTWPPTATTDANCSSTTPGIPSAHARLPQMRTRPDAGFMAHDCRAAAVPVQHFRCSIYGKRLEHAQTSVRQHWSAVECCLGFLQHLWQAAVHHAPPLVAARPGSCNAWSLHLLVWCGDVRRVEQLRQPRQGMQTVGLSTSHQAAAAGLVASRSLCSWFLLCNILLVCTRCNVPSLRALQLLSAIQPLQAFPAGDDNNPAPAIAMFTSQGSGCSCQHQWGMHAGCCGKVVGGIAHH